jgi:hypothetical protein
MFLFFETKNENKSCIYLLSEYSTLLSISLKKSGGTNETGDNGKKMNAASRRAEIVDRIPGTGIVIEKFFAFIPGRLDQDFKLLRVVH